MSENKHYYTSEQELAMELKRQQMIELFNSCDSREEQEIILEEIKKVIIGELKCQDCFNKVKNKIKWKKTEIKY